MPARRFVCIPRRPGRGDLLRAAGAIRAARAEPAIIKLSRLFTLIRRQCSDYSYNEPWWDRWRPPRPASRPATDAKMDARARRAPRLIIMFRPAFINNIYLSL